VIRLGALGDVVRTLPAVSALRAHYAGAHLAWLVEPPSAGVLERQPWVDEVLVFPRPALRRALGSGRLPTLAREARRFLRELRARRFDLALDFHAILKSGILARLSGAPVRASYAPPFGRELAWLFANRRARLGPGRPSRYDRNEALVRFLGIGEAPAPAPLRVDPEAQRRADAWLAGRPAPVAIHPGTSEVTPYKRYGVAGYAALARALASDGIPVVVSAGPARGERAMADAIVAASGGAAVRGPETQGIADLAALLSRARLFVGSDSGPLHVASLVGTPVVQILGPTHPDENRPWAGTPSRQVRVPIACSPCRRGCAAATCMRVVPPEAVIAAARELAREAGAGRARAGGARAGGAARRSAAAAPLSCG
jgi:ADP-heptose:LPS heptosyltransferase